MSLIAARVSLIGIESQAAKKSVVKSVICAVVAITALIITWALALAGSIAWIAEAQNWPWYGVALVAAGVHLLVGLVAARCAKPAAAPAFPITRAEFKKDREWIENLPKTKTSRN
jgi:uncharacterized membrane protein YqjE